MRLFHLLIASALGSGYAKFAPGTWGTLVGSIILGALWHLGALSHHLILLFLTVAMSIIGYWSITQLPKDWVQDDQRIVIDEVLGLWVAMLWIPISWKSLIASFILFRLFDIFKPLGIRKFDNIKSDAAVIVDDLVAGVYANLTLRLVIVVLSAYGIW